jgi:hypothetical protein
MNRPPGVLKRMPAAICHSMGVASAEVPNGYVIATLPLGMAVTAAEEK